ncbi:hypothetical protein CQY20_06450 [Mycolicibacterium agri]|nr:DUF3060 domain-containing protein [Mycolicibacterium agri]PEG40904.1 hypothetical protein CQY20_06450 [Mycolicibacterium agri]
MTREEDPEERIRQLERPLAELAQTSELGGEQPSSTAYLPPPVPGYSPQDYTPPTYAGPPPYGAPPYSTQPRKVSGGIPWIVFGLIAVVLVAMAAGVIAFVSKMSATSGISGGGGSIDLPSIPSIPPMPSVPSIEIPNIPVPPGLPGSAPQTITAAPGETVSVAGVENTRTVVCNDSSVSVSGVSNTVTITGHCVSVTVSGMDNVVTVDASDTIGASGFDNRITYHSGAPQINATESNIVVQG